MGMEWNEHAAQSTAVNTDSAILYWYRMYCKAHTIAQAYATRSVIHNASRLVGLRWTFRLEKQHACVYLYWCVCSKQRGFIYDDCVPIFLFFCRRPMAAPSEWVYFDQSPSNWFCIPLHVYHRVYWIVQMFRYIKLKQEWEIKPMKTEYFEAVSGRMWDSNFTKSDVCWNC